MVICRNPKLAHVKFRPSPRNRNAFPLPDASGPSYLEMKMISSALHPLKPFGQVHRHEPEGEKHHTSLKVRSVTHTLIQTGNSGPCYMSDLQVERTKRRVPMTQARDGHHQGEGNGDRQYLRRGYTRPL